MSKSLQLTYDAKTGIVGWGVTVTDVYFSRFLETRVQTLFAQDADFPEMVACSRSGAAETTWIRRGRAIMLDHPG